MPAAPSVWPTIVFIDPTISFGVSEETFSGGSFSLDSSLKNASCIAEASWGSPACVLKGLSI